MAVTLKMISERVGLSQAAVSQILNRKPNDLSSEGTKRKVFALAEELGYKQKFGHKLLRGDRTDTVAVLIDTRRLCAEEHIQTLVMKLLMRLEQAGYSSYLSFLGCGEKENLAAVSDLAARGAEGFIVIGAPTGETVIEEEFIRLKKNFVGMGTHFSRNVTVSAEPAVREILRFFLARRRENFRLLLPGDFEHTSRFAALKTLFPQLSEEKLAERYCVRMRNDHTGVDELGRIGCEATRSVFEKDPGVSAIFYHSDYYAMGGLAFLQGAGRIPGKDVLIAGYNNIHAVRSCCFPISSVLHPTDENVEALIEGLKQTGAFSRTLYARAVIRETAGFAAPERIFR